MDARLYDRSVADSPGASTVKDMAPIAVEDILTGGSERKSTDGLEPRGRSMRRASSRSCYSRTASAATLRPVGRRTPTITGYAAGTDYIYGSPTFGVPVFSLLKALRTCVNFSAVITNQHAHIPMLVSEHAARSGALTPRLPSPFG